ncbi:PadR family transcriptional regulator [Salaquimonas pukyongi]|uniref:PadR family transcriptional regulator n=1 Tax=Salaquimonas pukyongi TaxID=2712698 RepID=UPI00096BCB89|nr:PadR family transcriptional regulator [Salaquimonas pukyongi]
MNVVRLLVLGALRETSPSHGYAIGQLLEDWQVQTWTRLRSGSVYHALRQMTKEGLITAGEQETGDRGPGKTRFTITNAGDAEFFALLREALASSDLIELSSGIAFLDALPEEGPALLAETTVRLNENAHRLQKIAATTSAAKGAPRTHDLLIMWSANLFATAGSLAKILARE